MMKMKIGAQLYTVREFMQTPKDFEETIKKVAEIGYKYVQVSGIGNVPAKDVANICNAHGIEIVLTHTAPDRILHDIVNVIDEHHIMGAKYIGLGSMPESYERSSTGVQSFIEDFAPSIREIEASDMKFLYHNHAYEFEKHDGKRLIRHIMEGLPNIGFTLDTYWVQFAGGSPASWIRRLKGRVPVLHLKDMCVVQDKQRMCEVMTGNMSWPAIFAAILEGGVEYGMVEQDDCYGKDPFECLKTSYNNLRGVI